MADALLSGLVKTILGNLNSLILQEAGLGWSYKREMTELKSTLSTILAVLQDAEEKQLRSAAMRNWLTKLKDAAYNADDLLDEYATEVLARSLKIQVCSVFSLSSSLALCFRMGHRIKEIRKSLDGIAADRSKFHLKDGILEEQLESSDRQYHTHSFIIETQIYGREGDKLNIIGLLIDDVPDKGNESVIPIVGMGGIGKTALAQLVYNDQVVQSHFDLRMWVCISELFDWKGLVQAVIESATGKCCSITSMDGMIHALNRMLKGKRFLLVLDDVWSEDNEMWDRFKKVIFNCGAKGSKVIVTTRSEKVAMVSGDVNPHQLVVLSDEDCWSLFKQRAFTMERKEEPNLVTIGKEIVKKCGGLPLAAKALGSLMRFKYEENQWLSIKESEIWNLPDDENVIMPALRLSYNHLPSHLKQCFAYCSIFPKGYEIEKDKLILLWIANGFVPIKRRMTLEDVGNEIFNDLLMRSFFQDVQQIEGGGKITKCKMHYLMTDLALVIMRNECSIIQLNKESFDIERIRHVCCDVRPLIVIPSSLYRAQSMRTFLLLSPKAGYLSSTVTPDIRNFRLLRVLALSHTSIEDLPISIANLKHIRYLDLSFTCIKSLPKSFNTLQNLQTLLLECCRSLLKLPERLSDISSLRHININGCQSLIHMPKQIGKLTCLQTLTEFIVGKNKGSSIGELQGLDLRGELHIRQLENVSSEIDAKHANLSYKGNIQSLGLSWKEDRDGVYMGKNDEEVLAALEPHENLKMFQLKGYLGVEIPCWMKSSSIRNLVVISIVKCRNIKRLPDLGKLQFLKVLFIEGMDALENINCEFYGTDDIVRVPFPSLKVFTLGEMPNLDEWLSWDRIGLFPCLAKLIIRKCPKLRTMPHIPSLQQMVLKESNELLLRRVANFTSLSSLHIGGFPEMKSLPEGMLQNLNLLRSFKLEDCPKLSSLSRELGNQLLTFKGKLTVWNCANLMSISETSGREHSSVGAEI